MNGQENTRGRNILNYASMAAGFIGIASSVIAQQNGVTQPEVNFLAVSLASNAIFGIINASKVLPDAIRLNFIRNPEEQRALFTQAFNELGLAFLGGFSGLLCGYAAGLGH